MGPRQIGEEGGGLTPYLRRRGAGRRPEAILTLIKGDQDQRRVGGILTGRAIVAE